MRPSVDVVQDFEVVPLPQVMDFEAEFDPEVLRSLQQAISPNRFGNMVVVSTPTRDGPNPLYDMFREATDAPHSQV